MPILKNIKKSKILLDTHVFLWIVSENSKISTKFKKTILTEMESENIFISPISIWEIGMLEAKGRINLKMNVYDWIEEALCNPIISLISFSIKIALDSSNLPGEFHGDPADRIIAASAIDARAVLVTADEQMLSYGKQSSLLNVLDPT